MSDIQYVVDRQALGIACDTLSTREWVAVDTEFVRERTYFSRLALVQLASEDCIFCVDPLAIDDLTALFDLLERRPVLKVFHAAGQDIETLFHLRGAVTTPVFDTQIAASLLGFGDQTGYAQVVEKLLGVSLDKSPARTDWMNRPLSRKQLAYAADDVRYLREIYPLLVDRLRAEGRLEWMADELAYLQDAANFRPDPPNAWTRVKGTGKLNRLQLNVLRHLADWRERQAMKIDKPRKWIVSDDALVNLAMQQPEDEKALLTVRLLSERTATRYADTLLGLIEKGRCDPEEMWPAVKLGKRPTSQEEATLDMLMAVVRIKAAEHRLSPGQITTRSELLKIMRGSQACPLQKGWRYDVAGDAVMKALEGTMTLVCRSGSASLRQD